jgi:hypothetical protein
VYPAPRRATQTAKILGVHATLIALVGFVMDVLVVIGASHKPFLESYLSRMMDIELVQLATFVENAD